MALPRLRSALSYSLGLVSSSARTATQIFSPGRPVQTVGQTRGYYVDWKMLRDVKRRQMAFEYANERLRINAIRKNTILPQELKETADKEIAALPRDSCPVRIRNRCVMTSRPRGVKRRWRLSRIVFRHLADHNQMSGIQRAMW
ncbi:28S ribosomal protein S14, mitochondrial [Latimeria chalumnae]|uniref:28S ribosomal protein S14, mitochondrial n=1 Tax=Latimeria chalumnae TaxID=7897 RepID=H3AMF2_LATCH|nr:PREDICTED: 28S ribosomal protein S14, mitochondrial [Latimeria chalumnae]|eukprot:XP_006003168.1 PREDICTED: 28S ribosomal protein S14, mitochondrial [Latimeria chalumnae]